MEGRNGGNLRNGRTTKRVKTDAGEVAIEVPRDREGTLEPQLVRKGRRRLPGFDEKVIALYARGMTTREIQAHRWSRPVLDWTAALNHFVFVFPDRVPARCRTGKHEGRPVLGRTRLRRLRVTRKGCALNVR